MRLSPAMRKPARSFHANRSHRINYSGSSGRDVAPRCELWQKTSLAARSFEDKRAPAKAGADAGREIFLLVLGVVLLAVDRAGSAVFLAVDPAPLGGGQRASILRAIVPDFPVDRRLTSFQT